MLRALIVEPNERVAEHLHRRLCGEGVECLLASSMSPFVAMESYHGVGQSPDMLFVRCNATDSQASGLISQLRGATEADIVAVGDESDSHFVLKLLRAGASDYLRNDERFDEELRAILNRFRIRDRQRPGGGAMISVASASGGCGASTVALNLTAALIRQGQETCLVDMAMCGGDLAVMLDAQPQHTLIDLCQHAQELDPESIRRSLFEHRSGVRLLAAPEPFSLEHPAPPDLIASILTGCRSTFSRVVVDLEDVFHREQLATIRDSEMLALVVRLDLPCLMRCRQTIAFLEREGISRDRIRIVANRHGQKNELPPKQVKLALGQSIEHYLPDCYAIAALAANVGNPIISEAPNSPLAMAFIKMAKSFCQATTA